MIVTGAPVLVNYPNLDFLNMHKNKAHRLNYNADVARSAS